MIGDVQLSVDYKHTTQHSNPCTRKQRLKYESNVACVASCLSSTQMRAQISTRVAQSTTPKCGEGRGVGYGEPIDSRPVTSHKLLKAEQMVQPRPLR